MAKRNNKQTKMEGVITEAPYEQVDVASEVESYHCGNSIPDLLKAILTELVRARVGG
jgi:hypothetical protein